jgi:hypothetical protein
MELVTFTSQWLLCVPPAETLVVRTPTDDVFVRFILPRILVIIDGVRIGEQIY